MDVGCLGKGDADGCAVAQLRVGELEGLLWDQSWCNTVSKLVMKLDAIKLGRALATYISDATPCSSSVRSRQGTTVFVSEGTDGHVPPRGPT